MPASWRFGVSCPSPTSNGRRYADGYGVFNSTLLEREPRVASRRVPPRFAFRISRAYSLSALWRNGLPRYVHGAPPSVPCQDSRGIATARQITPRRSIVAVTIGSTWSSGSSPHCTVAKAA